MQVIILVKEATSRLIFELRDVCIFFVWFVNFVLLFCKCSTMINALAVMHYGLPDGLEYSLYSYFLSSKVYFLD